MPHMFVRHRVAGFDEWKSVFDSHAAAQREAGFKFLHLFRSAADRNDLFLLFEIADAEAARRFVTSPDVPEAQRAAGVIGEAEVHLLEE